MTGMQLSLLTYGLLVVIAMGVAVLVWALPRVLDFLSPRKKQAVK